MVLGEFLDWWPQVELNKLQEYRQRSLRFDQKRFDFIRKQSFHFFTITTTNNNNNNNNDDKVKVKLATVVEGDRKGNFSRCKGGRYSFPWIAPLYLDPYLIMLRCPWCSRYRRRKWTRRHEFKSWTRLIAFHIALIPLGKVWIQLFSLQLWVNSRTD